MKTVNQMSYNRNQTTAAICHKQHLTKIQIYGKNPETAKYCWNHLHKKLHYMLDSGSLYKPSTGFFWITFQCQVTN
jgi:hypothetical protein